MSLTNPIAFRTLTEDKAKTTATVTAGSSTASVMGIVESPDTSKANIETGGNGALYFKGKKFIQGVSADEKKYLYDQLASVYNGKYAVAVASYSPTSGTYGTDLNTAKTITFTVTTKHNGKAINASSTGAKVSSIKVGSTALTETSTAGTWSGTMTAAANTTGSQSVSATVTVVFTGDYGTVTKTVTPSWGKYAPWHIVSSTAANLATAMSGDTSPYNKTSYAGTYSFKTTADTDMWICFPSKWGKPTIKSGGFYVPFDTAKQVTVGGVVYNCFRKSTTPTASTGTVTIVLS